MRGRQWWLVAVLCAAVLGNTRALAAQPTVNAPTAWVALPPAGAKSADVFVEVANPTMYDIYITAATTDAAAKVELHGPSKGGGDAPLVTEFAVPAYGSIEAAATAPHLRLVDLSRALAAGETVTLTLTTDNGVQVKVAATVRTP